MWIYITYITHVTGLKIFKMSRQNPRFCQDIQDEIQELNKNLKMSRQNLRSFQDIQEFKIFLRSWQDIQDVKRWNASLSNDVVGHASISRP